MYITPDFKVVEDTSEDPNKKNMFISLLYAKKDKRNRHMDSITASVTDAIESYKALVYEGDKRTLPNFSLYKLATPVIVLATLPDNTNLVLRENGKISID